jgi:hypothetical protein
MQPGVVRWYCPCQLYHYRSCTQLKARGRHKHPKHRLTGGVPHTWCAWHDAHSPPLPAILACTHLYPRQQDADGDTEFTHLTPEELLINDIDSLRQLVADRREAEAGTVFTAAAAAAPASAVCAGPHEANPSLEGVDGGGAGKTGGPVGGRSTSAAVGGSGNMRGPSSDKHPTQPGQAGDGAAPTGGPPQPPSTSFGSGAKRGGQKAPAASSGVGKQPQQVAAGGGSGDIVGGC